MSIQDGDGERRTHEADVDDAGVVPLFPLGLGPLGDGPFELVGPIELVAVGPAYKVEILHTYYEASPSAAFPEIAEAAAKLDVNAVPEFVRAIVRRRHIARRAAERRAAR